MKAAIKTKTMDKMMRKVKSQPTMTLQMNAWKPLRLVMGGGGGATCDPAKRGENKDAALTITGVANFLRLFNIYD